MKKAYSYAVIKYVHDPVADEALNIGVIVYSLESRFVEVKVEYNFERYSQAFANFDSQRYRQILHEFEAAVENISEHLSGGDLFRDVPADAAGLVSRIWPDTYLSFRSGSTLRGLTTNLTTIAAELFERFVESQYAASRQVRRTDEEVWSTYRRKLAGTVVPRMLHEKTFATDSLSLTFQHCIRNERWHILQPISFDYARSNSIAETAAKWLGETTVLADNADIRSSKLYLLLGAPHEKKFLDAYRRAKKILAKIPIPHAVYEEHQADEFAADISEHVVVNSEAAEI